MHLITNSRRSDRQNLSSLQLFYFFDGALQFSVMHLVLIKSYGAIYAPARFKFHSTLDNMLVFLGKNTCQDDSF